MDGVTVDRIAKLHPAVRSKVTECAILVDKVLTGRAAFRIVQGYRSFAEQNAIYAQGRTTKGPNVSAQRPMGNTVSNAPAGKSYHNYGLAIDFALLIDGKEISWDMTKDYDGDKIADWKEVVDIFKAAGFEWGGDWHSLKDNPHFQMTFGYTEAKLLAMYNSKQFIPDTEYVNIKVK